MAKKSISDDAFIGDMKAASSGHTSMVMTKPPVGPSKSLEEILSEQFDPPAPVGEAPPPKAVESVAAVATGIDSESNIALQDIVASPFQVRHVDDQAIDDLAESIRDTQGLITPIVVRALASGKYELIAGHTRYAACQRLGHLSIPAIVREMSDAEAAKALAADNLTRKDLTDFETFKQINLLEVKEFVRTNSEIARLLGRSRQDVIRYKAFGRLPAEVIDLLERDPALIGASCAKELVDLIDEGAGTFVIEGCVRLFDGQIKNQSALVMWIHQQNSVRPARNEFRVVDPNGKAFAKVSISSSGIKISGRGLDFSAVAELLRRELPNCRNN